VRSAVDYGDPERASGPVEIHWNVAISLRDGIRLSATTYLPKESGAKPAILTLTPYVKQTYHDQGMYFAGYGYPFITVDVRGRGNSEGVFRPMIQETTDAYDVVEWLARQRYCDGKVAMWGGSYAGYAQWVAAKGRPPHLATIAPVASPFIGLDFPMRNNVFYPYLVQWLTLVAGKTAQDRIFWHNHRFWRDTFLYWLESGTSFRSLGSLAGDRAETFEEWLSHPHLGDYWDAYNPTPQEYAGISLPVLTITGIYDSDQPGALAHYQQHLSHCSDEARARHYLVVGPWDHAGTRAPLPEVAGLDVGPASLVDLPKLHRDWYAWTMQGGPKPEFLKKNVAYYVTGRERWRYADRLEHATVGQKCLYLSSTGAASSIFASGELTEKAGRPGVDTYHYDPVDTRGAHLQARSDEPHALRPTFPVDNLSDQTQVFVNEGRQLIYHSTPAAEDFEITGFFKLAAWISIDQADADFCATVYEIRRDGSSLLLSTDCVRARYREDLREERLVRTQEPLLYSFARFTFVSRLVVEGSRLRLVVGPLNALYFERNYSAGGVVADETVANARAVRVRLFHDRAYPSALYVPIGRQ
jgi:putative CocE/NonD family hydrolase